MSRLRKFAHVFSHASIAAVVYGAVGSHDVPEPDADGLSVDAIIAQGLAAPLPASPQFLGTHSKFFMQFVAVSGEPVSQPIGHHDFCKRLPEECAPIFENSEAVILDDRLMVDLHWANKEINERYEPASDAAMYVFDEYWTYPESRADCEDYALQKRKELHENLGIPLNAMSLVVVRNKDGEGHAILAVRTDAGDLILDNLTDQVLYPFQTGYEFLKATSFQSFAAWQEIMPVKHIADWKEGEGKGALIDDPAEAGLPDAYTPPARTLAALPDGKDGRPIPIPLFRP
ncbi:MAG: transglutaminase-like cysteine peptidase [Micavibrio sp.]